MILLDTDHFSILRFPHSPARLALTERLENAADVYALPIVVAEESWTGWQAAIGRCKREHDRLTPYRHLAQLLKILEQWHIVEYDEAAMHIFLALQTQRLRIGTNDLRIAAIALAQNALLLSANLRDYRKVPGLRVENWLPTKA